MSDEFVAVFGHAAGPFARAGLSSDGVDAEMGFELIGRLEAIDALDVSADGGGGFSSDAFDGFDDFDIVAITELFDALFDMVLLLLETLDFLGELKADGFGGGGGVVSELLTALLELDDGALESIVLGEVEPEAFMLLVVVFFVAFEDVWFFEREGVSGVGDGLGVGGIGFGCGHGGGVVLDDLGVDFVEGGDATVEVSDELLAMDAGGFEVEAALLGIGQLFEEFSDVGGSVGAGEGFADGVGVLVENVDVELVLCDVDADVVSHVVRGLRG